MSVVLDTSALSRVMHRRPEALSRLAELDRGQVFLASPVAAEIAYGLERLEEGLRRREILQREYDLLRDLVRWADWDEAAALRFGQLKARLAVAGLSIQDMDLAVASIALGLGAALATCNAGHFSRIEGLDVDDWGRRR
ncbi:MAG: type II toxin-antitoxin system VapC family toxin [Deltaproteobacteria bacterium]|nr:type II toxin-antitoxin system VapC family toxin [Deltaproteobacteria bacterium]